MYQGFLIAAATDTNANVCVTSRATFAINVDTAISIRGNSTVLNIDPHGGVVPKGHVAALPVHDDAAALLPRAIR